MANTVIHTPQCRPVAASSKDKILFSMNLLIYKAEFFLRASVGVGINGISPGLVQGPVPIGATLANITNSARRVIEELGLATVGHLRAIKQVLRSNLPFPGPQLDLSAQVFAGFVNLGFNVSTLSPPFNIYANTLSFGLAAEAICIYSTILRRNYTFDRRRRATTVPPYTFTMAELTNRTSEVVNRLGGCGVKDEGLIVPFQLGAENRSTSNVVPGDVNSLAHARFEREILRIVFGTGNATMPGGLFPDGFIGALYQLIINLKLS
ncbi:desiccation-related protein PCC13-62 [Gossypium hirsutum]|uniref:Desiccation-related protein PCC13-62 n=1 Tax=Gossypium hirsutum TaxID=3635 RepID=A0ABM3B9S2_GOSHI|nr:desiccation-related protein PCC13-62-like [Gossypium hirsutum]